MTPRCVAVLILADGSSVACVELDHGAPRETRHRGYQFGRFPVAWSDASEGAAVRVSLGRRRRMMDLLETSRAVPTAAASG